MNKALLLFFPALLSGCMASGGLYRNTVKPLSRNFADTPIGARTCIVRAHRVKEPISGYGVSAEWDANDILRAMKEAGMTRIHVMDLREFGVFFNTYSRRQIIVHGD